MLAQLIYRESWCTSSLCFALMNAAKHDVCFAGSQTGEAFLLLAHICACISLAVWSVDPLQLVQLLPCKDADSLGTLSIHPAAQLTGAACMAILQHKDRLLRDRS